MSKHPSNAVSGLSGWTFVDDAGTTITFKGRIGKGHYGAVYDVTYLTRENVFFGGDCPLVCKVQDLNRMSPEERMAVENETRVMRMLSERGHPLGLVYEGYYEGDLLFIITKKMTGGTLKEYLESRVRGRVSEECAVVIVRQILEELSILEELGICHRDIKPENIFLTHGGDFTDRVNPPRCVIGDFGLSAFCPRDARIRGAFGNDRYSAPEVFNSFYSVKCDVWSLGVVMARLLIGKTFDFATCYFVEKTLRDGLIYIKTRMQDRLERVCSAEAVECFTQLCTADYENRKYASEMLMHSWFRKCVSVEISTRDDKTMKLTVV